jgi:hypothetical protein
VSLFPRAAEADLSSSLDSVAFANQIYAAPGLSPYDLLLESEAGEIRFDTNKIVGDWSDVDVNVGQRLIAAFKDSRLNHDDEGFLAALQSLESGSHFGAAVRWALNTHPNASFSLDFF